MNFNKKKARAPQILSEVLRASFKRHFKALIRWSMLRYPHCKCNEGMRNKEWTRSGLTLFAADIYTEELYRMRFEMGKMKIKLHDMLLSLSSTVDIITPEFGNHHQQVARLAYRLAEQMELPLQTKHMVYIAGMLHDIGALSQEDRVISAGTTQMPGNCHAFRGAQLLEGYPLLTPVARAVRYHHIPWENGEGKWFHGEQVPMEKPSAAHGGKGQYAYYRLGRCAYTGQKYRGRGAKSGRAPLYARTNRCIDGNWKERICMV